MGNRTTKALLGAALALSLAACVETLGDEEILSGEPGKLRVAQVTKSSSPKGSAAKSGLPEQVRARLRQECMAEHSGPFRIDAASDGECECYATNVVKSLRSDDLEFFLNYNVVPTLSGTRPEDVKKTCGIKVLDQSGSRSRAPLAVPTN